MAYGNTFANEDNPAAMITVGTGEQGTAQLQNIIFTSRGALPGLVMVQWNMKATTKGSVGMWGKFFLQLLSAYMRCMALIWDYRLSFPCWWCCWY
jgi:hypothetical protein